jgi:hypothetical protein
LPFPQPFGGKRKVLTDNYEITYKGKAKLEAWKRPGMKAEEAKAPEEEFEHLLMVPKLKSQAAKDYLKVEFWIDPDTGLVRQLRTVDKAERILTVRFKNVKTNEAAKDVDDKALSPKPLQDGWQEQVNDHTEEETTP